jgi:hypothetical protein
VLELTPGRQLDLAVWSVRNALRPVLKFEVKDCEQRPELAKWMPDRRQAGVPMFTDPGAGSSYSGKCTWNRCNRVSSASA